MKCVCVIVNSGLKNKVIFICNNYLIYVMWICVIGIINNLSGKVNKFNEFLVFLKLENIR